jgi:hypothetical protein
MAVSPGIFDLNATGIGGYNKTEELLSYIGRVLVDPDGTLVLGPGENHIGSVGGNTSIAKITGAQVGVSGAAYASGDVLGDQSPIAVSVMRINNGTAVLQSVVIGDLSNQSAALDLLIFDANPSGSTFTDNSPVDIADADLPKLIGTVSVAAADYVAFADSSAAVLKGIALPIKANGAYNTVWVVPVTRGTPTYVADELSISLGVLQD